MALSYTQFIVRFPEFKTAHAELVQAKLDDSAQMHDVDIWGERYDLGHGLYAAHLLSLSPSGQNARMVVPAAGNAKFEPSTTYLAQWRRIRNTVCIGHRFA